MHLCVFKQIPASSPPAASDTISLFSYIYRINSVQKPTYSSYWHFSYACLSSTHLFMR